MGLKSERSAGGTVQETTTRRVYCGVWYRPWTWFKWRTERINKLHGPGKEVAELFQFRKDMEQELASALGGRPNRSSGIIPPEALEEAREEYTKLVETEVAFKERRYDEKE